MSFIPLLQTATTGTQANQVGNTPFGMIGSILFAVLIFYFLIIRPQNKKNKETEKMLNALQKGDRIITIGGIHGTVSSVKDKTVIVKVDENTKLEFNRSAIATVQKSEAELAKEAEAKAAKEAAKKAKKSKKATEDSVTE